MRKLKLDVEDLVVDSFVADPERAGAGTVFGHATYGESCEGTCNTNCWGQTCPGCGGSALAFCTAGCGSGQEATCDASCNTCGDSCDGWHSCINTCAQTCWDTCAAACPTVSPCDA